MRNESELLTEFLGGADAECDACGQGLRGISQPRCPECGRELRLAVSAKQHTLAPWLFAIVSLALGAGFDGVGAILICVRLILAKPTGSAVPVYVYLFPATFALVSAVQLLGIVLIARRRRGWGRRSTESQWFRAAMLACVIFMVHVSPVIVFRHLL